MQVTVKLATREGAAHISGILAGFTLLAKRGELTLRVRMLIIGVINLFLKCVLRFRLKERF